MLSRHLLSFALALLAIELAAPVASWAAPPPASTPALQPVDEQTEFEKGRNAYRAQKYDEADARFIRMLDPKAGVLHDKVLIKQARMYWAATLMAEHHEEEATLLFESILTDDRDYEPDPLAFPTEVVNAFIDTRARLREKLEAIERDQYRRAAERRLKDEAAKQAEVARVKLLEEYATRAEVTEKRRRLIALVPFGAGQFQNGQRGLGWAFLGAEGLFLAGAIATVPVYLTELHNASAVYSVPNQGVAQQYLDRANAARYANLAFNGALALTAVIGVIQAEVAFVPEVTKYRVRTVPGVSAPSAPAATPSPPAQAPPAVSFGAAPLSGRDGHSIVGAVMSLRTRF